MIVPKIAIIGCGTVAQRYYVPALKRHPELAEGLFFVDMNTGNAEAMRKELKRGQVRRSYSDVLSEVNGAVVLLPHFLHYPVALDFLEAGVPVLCEKPLAILPHEAHELVETAEKNKAALCVNNTRRMFPNFRHVKEIIESGRLGRILEIDYQEGSTFGWPSPTGFYVNPKISSKGILLDLGSHVIDTLCWWVGEKPDLTEYYDDSYGGPESVSRIRAEKGGCSISVTLNRLCDLKNTYRVVCENGSLEGRIFDWTRVSLKNGSNVYDKKIKSPSRNYPGFVLPIFDNFIQVIKGEKEPLIRGRDVLASIEFIHECYEKRKRLDMPWDKSIRIQSNGKGRKASRIQRKILVTGATGFIGGRIAEMAHLAQSKNFAVAAGVRQWSGAARLGRLPVDIVELDIMDKAKIDSALEGVTHVVHCAKGTPQATVEGTRNLLDASLEKGIKHFIHLSTADVYGEVTGVIDEEYPFLYTGNTYNRMKIDAEKACREYQDKGLPVTIFRPSIVYGPYSSNWSLRFAAMFLKGEWGVYEKYGDGKCNLVYVDDLVKTIFNALDKEDAFGKAFNINGPEVISWNDYFTRLNNTLNLPPLKTIKAAKADASTYLTEPVRVVGGFVKRHFLRPVKMVAEKVDFVDALMRRLEHAVKTTPAPDELKLFTRDALYSDMLARNTLSYCPDTRVDKGLESTLGWVRYLGLLNT